MTDDDLADWHARQKAEQEEIERGAAKTRALNQTLNKGGIFAAFPHLRPRKGD